MRLAVEVLDHALGIDLVERAFVLDACARRAGPGTRATRRARRRDPCTRIASARPSPSMSPGIQRGWPRSTRASRGTERTERPVLSTHSAPSGEIARHDVEQHVAHALDERRRADSSASGSRCARSASSAIASATLEPASSAACMLPSTQTAGRMRSGSGPIVRSQTSRPSGVLASDCQPHERRVVPRPTPGAAR